MSILQRLPESVTACGREYAINTDFRVWIEVEKLIFDKSVPYAERIAGMFVLALTEPPKGDPAELAKRLLEFCFGSDVQNHAREDGAGSKAVFDYDEDAEYIYSAFLGEFGIDLTTEPLHWHKFKALLKSLGEGCKFSKIVGYRSTDTAKIKDKEQRRFYKSMKRLYSLPDRRTDDEKEADLVEGLGMFF